MVQEGKTALLSPSGDVAAFAANLLKLIEDETLRKSLSGHGIEYVLENFSHLRLAKDMAELYRKLLAEKGL